MKKKDRRTTSIKSIVICADDFGQNPEICEGIMALAYASRINAVSCMVNVPSWFDAQPDLLKLPSSCAVGLHLNLTFGQALSDGWRRQVGEHFKGLSNLIQKTYMHALDPNMIFAELKAQLSMFIETMDRCPDFIDGHQHAHQLPQVREALVRLYQTQGLTCPIRQTSNGWKDLFNVKCFPKAQAIACLGGLRFAALLAREHIPTNTHFAGIYSFNAKKTYRQSMQSFLANSRDGGLIMCHPGLESHDRDDPIRHARVMEWDYLMSDMFLTDLENASCQLSTDPN